MPAADQGLEFGAQLGRACAFGQAVGEEVVDLGEAVQGPVGQGHEAVAQVAHGRHVEVPPEHRRAAARVEGRDQVHGVVGVADQGLARLPEGRAAGEEEDARAQVGRAQGPGHADLVRDADLAGDADGGPGHAFSSSRRQPSAAKSKSTPPLISKTRQPFSPAA